MEFKGTKKIHAVVYAGFVRMNDEPYYEGKDLLDFEDVGETEAMANAKLFEASYDLLEASIKRIEWSKKYPSHRIFSGSAMQEMIKESNEIDLEIQKAIEKTLK